MWRRETNDGHGALERPSWVRNRAILVLAFCTSLSACSSNKSTPEAECEHTQTSLLAKWMSDLAEESRQNCMEASLTWDAGFYHMLTRDSDDASIVANAAAAVQILRAVADRHWAETPLAVFAVVVAKGEGPSEPARFLTNTCDLTRNTKTHVIDIQLPPEMGRRLEIRLENILTSGPKLKFSMGFSAPVEIAPLRKLLDMASPTDKEEVWRIVVDCNQNTEEPILLPDPSIVPMFFSAVNALGRRSNAITITRIGGGREAGEGAPRKPLGSMSLKGPFYSYPHADPAKSQGEN